MNRSIQIYEAMIQSSYFAIKNNAKLKPNERELIKAFLEHNDKLSIAEREMKANRLFIDQPDKPRNWTLILEMLSWTNSRIRIIERHNLPFDADMNKINLRAME